MKPNFKIIIVASCLIFSLFYSLIASAKPNKCPSVEVLKYRSLLNSQPNCDGKFVAFQYDKFGTDTAWLFAMDELPGSSKTEALDNGIKLLPQISGNPEPVQREDGYWVCQYANLEGVQVETFTMDSDNGNGILGALTKFNSKK